MSWEARAQGYPDYQLRSLARQEQHSRSTVPLLATAYRPVAGAFALERQQAGAVSALDQDFTWQAAGQAVGCSTLSGGNWLLRAPFWLPREWDLALNERRGPLYLNQGYPLRVEEELEFRLPPRAQPVVLPGVMENQAAPLRWRIEWTKSGPDKVTARLRAELARGELSPADTPILQQQLGELLSALANCAAVSLPAESRLSSPASSNLQPSKPSL